MFRNLVMYELGEAWTITAADLESAVSKHPLVPPLTLSPGSAGWLPFGPKGSMVFSVEKHLLLLAGFEDKVVPGSAVKRRADELIAEFEKSKGFAAPKRMRREFKQKALQELLAKAITKTTTAQVWIDLEARHLCIDTASAKRADDVTSMLRDHLGELPVTPLTPKISPAGVMTRWLSDGSPDGAFELGYELVMKGGDKSTARLKNHPLVDSKEVASHLQSGKIVSSLGLVWPDRAHFVLTDKCFVKSLKFEVREDTEIADDPDVQFEADMRLATASMRELVLGLNAVFDVPAGA